MDFARKQLEKYGWSEGKGLGKQENGMVKAIKPRLKFDTAGVGHCSGEEFTNNWWENVYNNATKNIALSENDDGVKINLAGKKSIEISTKNYNIEEFKQKNNNMEYGTFLKTSKLTESGLVNYNNAVLPDDVELPKHTPLSDAELYKRCGGRTAHKGARHGLKLSGKLSRIEKQEKLLLKKLQNVKLNDDNEKTEKKLKKLSKNKDKLEEKDDNEILQKKKKHKKKRKSVSFNETVTEYHTQELDTSSQSSESVEPPVILKSKINDRDKLSEDISTRDEGIEQDCDMKSESLGQECFEEPQESRKEKKKKKNRATERFLEEVFDSEKPKRKYDEEMEASYIKKRCEEVSVKTLKKKKKKRKSEKNVINSIVASLDQVCRISDTEK